MKITEQLLAMQDLQYKAFHEKLVPDIPSERIIGVRMPKLRAFAKSLQDTPQATEFMLQLPHIYYEEYNLHALLVSQIPDFDHCIAALNHLLPYVDNWGTCDSIRPKCFAVHHKALLPEMQNWLASNEPFTVRFGIEMLMVHFLGADFDIAQLAMVAAQGDHTHYYVRMMVAWYFATALAKQPQATLPYLTEQRLPRWVHNKTIQKAIESYRIPNEMKAMLRTLRI